MTHIYCDLFLTYTLIGVILVYIFYLLQIYDDATLTISSSHKKREPVDKHLNIGTVS